MKKLDISTKKMQRFIHNQMNKEQHSLNGVTYYIQNKMKANEWKTQTKTKNEA
jgi:hypothetical protein